MVLFLGFQVLESQNQQLDIKISNDKFVFQDKYYTSGLHISYRKYLKNKFLFKQQKSQRLQLNILVGNETYTPSNLSSFNTNDFDRPYAGWLFVGVELAKIKFKSALFLSVESGITGEESLAGKLQNAFHELLNIEKPTWQDEIAYKWLFNFKIKQVYDIPLGNSTSIQNHSSVSVGSKDIYLKNSLFLFFGKFNTLQNSSRLNALSSVSKKEFFGFIGGSYKYVALNTLIQGSPFNDSDAFTSIAEKNIYSLQAGSVLRTRRNIFKLEYIYNSKETPLSTSHIFGAFTFGFVF
ncbi:lipid A-modifier LpxR family protein [Hyunsoonleella sp. 2307UL5-6]|uniref:lipid A-modifier LpxR family protein n=1 Tax=Hyunsoonleella sp. 2307UL5-6 TaxID=3384768 RepID=UPI0039BC697C